jgi:hypothetical protein
MARASRRIAHRLVFVRTFELLQRLQHADQRRAAARNHALFNGGTRGVQRVFDAGLDLTGLAGAVDDSSYASGF